MHYYRLLYFELKISIIDYNNILGGIILKKINWRIVIFVLIILNLIMVAIKIPEMNIGDWTTLLQGVAIGLFIGYIAILRKARR